MGVRGRDGVNAHGRVFCEVRDGGQGIGCQRTSALTSRPLSRGPPKVAESVTLML